MEDVFPRKVLINTLIGSSLPQVWISGKIEQTVNNDLLIVRDETGRVKVVGCDSANKASDSSWIQKGSYCSVIGKLVKNTGLPEIRAMKIQNVTNNVCIDMWKYEVKCLDLFMDEKIVPHVQIS